MPLATKPLGALGGFFAMAIDTLIAMIKPPFAWREYVMQTWFVAGVGASGADVDSAVLGTVRLHVQHSAHRIRRGRLRRHRAAIGTVNEIGPIVTVLVVSGAGATTMCADLGARTIREELDAMKVMGINPIQALVVPRVLAATTVALALSSTVIIAGLAPHHCGRRGRRCGCAASS